MQDNYQVSNSKVPLLGDIPWIGQLFRSESKVRAKTNLMVFLRPVIISDRSTAQEVTSNRYDYIQGVTGAYKSDNNVIRDKDDPVVPPMPIGPSQAARPPATCSISTRCVASSCSARWRRCRPSRCRKRRPRSRRACRSRRCRNSR